MNEPVFNDAAISEHAARVAESVRAINHLSIRPIADDALPYPSDVAAVTAQLARAVHGLPQALGQLAARLDRLATDGCIRDADPDPAGVNCAERAAAVLDGDARQAAARLARVLDAAGSNLSRLGYADPPAHARSAATNPHPAPERRDAFGVEL